MSHSQTSWRTDAPAGGVIAAELPADPPTRPALPVRTFLPEMYEPRYPYPLVVLFHAHGGNEEQVLGLAPGLSRRNFIVVSLRGPAIAAHRGSGQMGYGWGGPGADTDFLREYVVRAVDLTRRSYHVHTERVYLAGVNEGAEVAYRVGFAMPKQVAGVVALNGAMPKPAAGNPVFRFDAVRGLRVFIGHGLANAAVRPARADRDYRALYAAGADVTREFYMTTHKTHGDMLRDVNRWIISHVNREVDLLLPKKKKKRRK